MNIHEYQAKELYRQYGIPTGKGFPAFTVEDAVKDFLGPLQDTARRIASSLGDNFRATLWAPSGARAD